MSHRTLPFSSCAFVLGVAGAFAQSDQVAPLEGPLPDGMQMRIAIPAELAATGALGASAIGEFTGDGRLDAAVVIGAAAYVLVAPNSFQLYVPLDAGGAVRDVAVVPGAAPYGLDLLLCATESGLVAWSLSAASNALVPDLVLSEGWRDVERLAVGDLDGGAHADVVGLDGGGLRVAGATVDAEGGLADLFEFTTTDAILDLAPVRWDHGTRGLACMRQRSLDVLDLEGRDLESFDSLGDSVAMDVMREAGGDAVAWVAKVPSSSYEWLHVKRAGGASDDGIPLGTLNTSDIAAGDLDGDGDDDLVATSRLHPVAAGLVSSAADEPGTVGTNVFSIASERYFLLDIAPYDADMSEQGARLSLGDFDRDGDCDGFVGVEATREFVLQRSGLSLESEHAITVLEREWLDPTHISMDIAWPEKRPLDATHFEVSMWTTQSWNDPFSSQANAVFDVALAACAVSPESFKFEVELPNGQNLRPFYYYILIARLVKRDEQGVNVVDYPDTTLLLEWDDEIGIISGTSPIPNLGPMPPGSLPPRGQGSPVPPP